MVKNSLVVLAAALILSAPMFAQGQAEPGRGGRGPAPRPDLHKLDNYLCDWRQSQPRQSHGGLIERDILTHGDPQNPPKACAVLEHVNHTSYATLPARAGIAPMKLHGEQEVFFVDSGKGTLTSAGVTTDLYDGMAFFVPAEVEFSMKNTGDEDLHMYLFNEPIPANFKPAAKLVVRDINTAPIAGTTSHWVHIMKPMFGNEDGLATLRGIALILIDPMTVPEPHAHTKGTEEVWTEIKGTSLVFIGTQIRWQTPGQGYLAPPFAEETKDNVTAGLSFPHSNINPGTQQVRLIWFQAGLPPIGAPGRGPQ